MFAAVNSYFGLSNRLRFLPKISNSESVVLRFDLLLYYIDMSVKSFIYYILQVL